MRRTVFSIVTKKELIFANSSLENNSELLPTAVKYLGIPETAAVTEVNEGLTTRYIYLWASQEIIKT